MKKYTTEEKEAALARVRAGESEQKVAHALGIPRGTISGWMRREPKTAKMAVVVPEASGDAIEGVVLSGPHRTFSEWLSTSLKPRRRFTTGTSS